MAIPYQLKKNMTEPTPDSLSSPSSILSKFPDDILFQIFLLIVEKSGDSWDALLHPTSVCRRWRIHCLSQPRLWSYFKFRIHRCKGRPYIDPVIVNPDYGDLALTRLQLERSRNSPLFVDADTFCYPCHLIHYAKFQLLLEHAQRWRTVWLPEVQIGCTLGDSTEVLIPRSTRFPALRKLGWRTIEELPDFESDEAIPSLTFFSLQRSNCLVPATKNVIPWHNLKCLHIDCHSVTIPNIISLLARTQSLLQLEVHYMEEEDPPLEVPEHLEPIVLPHLVNLNLFDMTGNLTQILPYLILPSLKALWIQHSKSDAYLPAIINLIRASSCALTDLYWEIPILGVDSIALAMLLRECPALESLLIQRFSSVDPIPLPDTADLRNIRDVLLSSAPTQDRENSGNETPSLRLICSHLKCLTLARIKIDLPLLFEILESRLSASPPSGQDGSASVAKLTNVSIKWPIDRWDEDDRCRPHAEEMVEFERAKKIVEERLVEDVVRGLELTILTSRW